MTDSRKKHRRGGHTHPSYLNPPKSHSKKRKEKVANEQPSRRRSCVLAATPPPPPCVRSSNPQTRPLISGAEPWPPPVQAQRRAPLHRHPLSFARLAPPDSNPVLPPSAFAVLPRSLPVHSINTRHGSPIACSSASTQDVAHPRSPSVAAPDLRT